MQRRCLPWSKTSSNLPRASLNISREWGRGENESRVQSDNGGDLSGKLERETACEYRNTGARKVLRAPAERSQVLRGQDSVYSDRGRHKLERQYHQLLSDAER